jgi:hypothetical protein
MEAVKLAQVPEPKPLAQMLRIAKEAHQLINEFIKREAECPDRAWESVAQLKELVAQLQELRPAHAFRTKSVNYIRGDSSSRLGHQTE